MNEGNPVVFATGADGTLTCLKTLNHKHVNSVLVTDDNTHILVNSNGKLHLYKACLPSTCTM
jgi:hypothetical protein